MVHYIECTIKSQTRENIEEEKREDNKINEKLWKQRDQIQQVQRVLVKLFRKGNSEIIPLYDTPRIERLQIIVEVLRIQVLAVTNS